MKKFYEIISGTFLIAGTTIGAGMLGIPLVTAKAGLLPAFCITILVWAFMYLTGLLFLEATLRMKKGDNVLSITEKMLGKKQKVVAGSVFVFLYYCLMIAYFAAGAPLFSSLICEAFHVSFAGWVSYAVYAVVFGSIVAVGMKFVDRVNYILMIGLVLSFVLLVGAGSSYVSGKNFLVQDWKISMFAAPILFSAFGYHNVIPSLVTHFHWDVKVLRASILWGTLIPLLVYLVWQWVVMGILPLSVIDETMQKGAPVTQAMQSLVGKPWIQSMGTAFGFFAIITSLLGVAFSIVDFLGDGLGVARVGKPRWMLSAMTFLPPFIFTSIDPSIFLFAIGIAGGFGEAFLNGILPAWLVFVGRYQKQHLFSSPYVVKGGKKLLYAVFLGAFFVVILEVIVLLKGFF